MERELAGLTEAVAVEGVGLEGVVADAGAGPFAIDKGPPWLEAGMRFWSVNSRRFQHRLLDYAKSQAQTYRIQAHCAMYSFQRVLPV